MLEVLDSPVAETPGPVMQSYDEKVEIVRIPIILRLHRRR